MDRRKVLHIVLHLKHSEPRKAIEVGIEALGHLGYPIPIDHDEALRWAKRLRSHVPTDPAIIAVRHCAV
jgi:hypothetical protein